MLQRIFEKLKAPLEQESLSARSERMLPAAIYGALIATAYTLANMLVNVYTFPNLPLGFDWAHIFGAWAGVGFAFALAGAIAGWFSEEYNGIVAGGAIITALLALVFLFQLGLQNSALTMQSILMAIPLIGVSMLAAGGLRWTARRHNEIIHKDSAEIRPKRLASHISVILLAGLVLGVLGRMDLPAEQTLAQFHKYLQAAPNDPSALAHLPIKQVPSLPEHFGTDYVFYVRRSEFALGALDVTVRFVDGFTMTCLLPVGGSSFFTDCHSGQ